MVYGKGYGCLQGSVSLAFFLCLAAMGGPAARPVETPADAYVAELIERADDLRLHERPYWLQLLHFEPGVLGYRSQIDDPAFFLSPRGRRDARAELHATLRAFFEPVTEDEREHAVCRFVARYAWLKQELTIDEVLLPHPRCEIFEKTYEHIRPSSAALVFPAAFLNNPASMFGHTLLVLDREDNNRLLAKSISYAARLDGAAAMAFIVGSFIGGYNGYYAVQPYYEKVEEYGDIGYRDMWEYQLDLRPEELRRMVMHAWELQEIFSRYYFLTENCSYNILRLLDIARPSLGLARGCGGWVVPVETVKLVLDRGIVIDTVYRPSTMSTMKWLMSRLGPGEQDLAGEVARGAVAPDVALQTVEQPEAQAEVLDLAAEYAQYLYTRGEIPADAYRPRFLSILKERSALGSQSAVVPMPKDRPESGHDAHRLALGAGWRRSESFQVLRYRLVQHALADDCAGYIDGAQVEFLATDVRHYSRSNQWQLERLDLVSLVSLSPRNRLFKPISWRGEWSVRQRDFDKKDDRLVCRMGAGAGYAYMIGDRGFWYVLGEGHCELGDEYDDRYVVAPGVETGISWPVTGCWKVVARAEGEWFVSGAETFAGYEVSCVQNFTLSRNQAVSFELGWSGNDGFDQAEAVLLWNTFF